jgi:Uma2 family endonuclease
MPHLVRAEELPGILVPGKSIELVRGVLVIREPPSTRHGRVAAWVTHWLLDYVSRHALGVVIQDAGFEIESDPDTVRAPDVAFVSQSRVDEIPPAGFARLAPDLAVEVVSPNDRPGEVLAKVAQWLDAGSKLVWVIDPTRARAVVYRENGDVAIVAPDGALDGETVLPGFTCPIASVFR